MRIARERRTRAPESECLPLCIACSYAFGLVLWCILSGRTHAWANSKGTIPNSVAVIADVLHGDRPDLTAVRHDAPRAAIKLMQQAWAQLPALRPSALSVAQMLEDVITALPPEVASAGAPLSSFSDVNGVALQSAVDALVMRTVAEQAQVAPPSTADGILAADAHPTTMLSESVPAEAVPPAASSDVMLVARANSTNDVTGGVSSCSSCTQDPAAPPSGRVDALY